MATQTIDATLFASSHPDIVKRTSVSGLIFSVAMLLVGVFHLYLNLHLMLLIFVLFLHPFLR